MGALREKPSDAMFMLKPNSWLELLRASQSTPRDGLGASFRAAHRQAAGFFRSSMRRVIAIFSFCQGFRLPNQMVFE
jgi:hypothetical protein